MNDFNPTAETPRALEAAMTKLCRHSFTSENNGSPLSGKGSVATKEVNTVVAQNETTYGMVVKGILYSLRFHNSFRD